MEYEYLRDHTDCFDNRGRTGGGGGGRWRNDDIIHGSSGGGGVCGDGSSGGGGVCGDGSSGVVIIHHTYNELEIMHRIASRKAVENAAEKAKQLFLYFCSPEQRKEYEKNQTITVIGNLGGIYRLTTKKDSFNVTKIGNIQKNFYGKKLKVPAKKAILYCLTASGVPRYDIFLIQKLSIEIEEESFLRISQRMAYNISCNDYFLNDSSNCSWFAYITYILMVSVALIGGIFLIASERNILVGVIMVIMGISIFCQNGR